MGADDAILLSDRLFAGADTFATSRVLAAAIKKLAPYDMVFCGEASSDGSTEQVPPSLAEWLGVPHVSYVSEMSVTGGVARAKRDITDGYEVVEANLPILASMRLGCNTPRFPDFRRKRWADKEFKLTIWGANDLGLGPAEMGSEGSYTIVKELRSMKMPQRKSEVMTGDSKDIAAKIAKVIRES
jgi:electron transfer flavoprotein beta subunit